MALHFDPLEDDPNPWPTWPTVQALHKLFVEYATSDNAHAPTTHTAVQALEALSPARLALPPEEQVEEASSFMWLFWDTLVPIVKQIPFDHPCQERVAKLIQDLRGAGATGSGDHGTAQRSIWADISGLDETLQDFWGEPTKMQNGVASLGQWVNINSFVARLYGLHLFDAERFCIWTLRDSLESEGGRDDSDINEMRIQAASQWGQYSAATLLKTMTSTKVDDYHAQIYGSPEFQGTDACSRKRWVFWRTALEQGLESASSDRGRETVEKALEAMRSAEQGQPKA